VITPERQKQIKAATPENPVDLTPEEEAELRTQRLTQFQHDVGAGKFRLKAKPNTPAETMMKMKNQGLSHSDIAMELGMKESAVERVLERTYF